ncbi:MAG: hypothetical protein L3K17_05180 [Thermoplasmata archaeon]|nr:hypothetical protein [Thermoplasmata archaeon]
MKSNRVAIAAILVLMTVALLAAPNQLAYTPHSTAPASGPHVGVTVSALPRHSAPATPAPLTTFPRTVLIETFTGVWCIHCPAETQALHAIDESTSRNVLDIAELHYCAFPAGSGPCLENYVPPDGTSVSRGIFYNVCGFPDVFFDGNEGACGATNSASQMQAEYNDNIANASSIPGNVSIAQTAWLSSNTVTEHASVLSGVTGSYNAIAYLLEYINKLNQSNGYGPHDVDRVVRETLFNHPVSLVAGATSYLNVTSGVLNSTWNDRNLSVVTFIQQNSTHIVQNANMTTVTTLSTAVTANRTTVVSGTDSTITVHITNSSTGTALSGAAINLTATSGGSLSSTSGVTGSDGSFTSTFTADIVTTPKTVEINAEVAAANYTAGSGALTLVVDPIVLSAVPTGLGIAPGNLRVTLNWTTPAAGGTGVTYHIYRSTAQAGPFAAVGTSTTKSFVDTGLVGGHVYWYTVSAQNASGFSANSTPTWATGVTAAPDGLPQSVGWWLSIDSMNFTSLTNGSLSLYLPGGFFYYSFGPSSYAYTTPPTQVTASLTAGSVPLSISPAFVPRYASLQGTVTPTNATVSLDGASVAVVDGAFSELLVAGTYSLNVTASGFETNSTAVLLTPGNLTTANVLLTPVPTPSQTAPTGSSGAGLSANEMVALVGVVAVVAILVVAFLVSAKVKRPPARRPANKGPRPRAPPAPPQDEP